MSLILGLIKTKNRFARYLFIGLASYVIEMIVLFILHNIIGLLSLISVGISYWVGLIASFLLQKYVTFENHEKRTHLLARQIFVYTALVIFNYVVTLLLTRFGDKYISLYIIRTSAIILATCWNFPIYKYVIFRNIKTSNL